MLEVNEIFGPTIQGEGKFVGTPSIFIRFGRCNMRCEGFGVEYTTPTGEIKKSCDTYYAVDPCFKEQWEKLSSKEIINQVSKLLPNYKIDIVITGGEPLLYWKNTDFQELIKYYIQNGHRVTIETNASLDIEFTQEYQKNIVFSMSVKLSNSLEPYKKRINTDTLSQISKKTRLSYLKFVIEKTTKENTINEIKEILKQIPKIDVYLMPKGATIEELNINSQAVITSAIENSFIYSDRLHIRIWDNKRGV